MLPILNELLRTVIGLFGWFNKMSPATQQQAVKYAAWSAAGLLLVGRLKSLIDTIALVKTALGIGAVAHMVHRPRASGNSKRPTTSG